MSDEGKCAKCESFAELQKRQIFMGSTVTNDGVKDSYKEVEVCAYCASQPWLINTNEASTMARMFNVLEKRLKAEQEYSIDKAMEDERLAAMGEDL